MQPGEGLLFVTTMGTMKSNESLGMGVSAGVERCGFVFVIPVFVLPSH